MNYLFVNASYQLGEFESGIAAWFFGAVPAAVLGGIGNVPGAMVGGLTIGLIEAYAGQFPGAEWADVIIFSILVLVLVFMPAGLFGRMAPSKS